MFDLRSLFRSKPREGGGVRDDTPRTVPISRREKTVRSRRLYAPVELKPLSEDELRRLPVANRFSA